MSKSKSNLEAAAQALPLVEAYEDLLQPAAKELGKDLEVVAKLVSVALMPLRVAVWGGEKLERWLIPELAARLENVPSERLETPSALVAGPVLEALRFAATEETLRELYVNLLATAMDRDTAHRAHPSFVEVLKQMSPDEARILLFLRQISNTDTWWTNVPAVSVHSHDDSMERYTSVLSHFSLLGESADCTHKELVPQYTENLSRLGITTVFDDRQVVGDPDPYLLLEQHDMVRRNVDEIEAAGDGRRASIERESIIVTQFGHQFLTACVAPPDDALSREPE